MLVSLNEDFDGCETCSLEKDLDFKGKAGDGLLFRNVGPDGVPTRSPPMPGCP